MFYLTLPSNSSLETYPDNTLTNYKVKLHHTVDLTGSWEVGLTEIQYPHTWYNISNDEAWMEIVENPEAALVQLVLKNGFYPTPEKVVKSIWGLKGRAPGGDKAKIELDDITQKVTLTVEGEAKVTFSPHLARFLGFGQTEFTRGIHFAPWVADVNQGFYSLYVYSSIVQPSMVGDALVPLLRIVPIEGSSGEMITRTYENVQYIPLEQRQFDTLEIDIRDDTGKPVPFERGKVIVTLHFRQRHSS